MLEASSRNCISQNIFNCSSSNLQNMNKQNPFSLYDFLGYLIPGALAIYAVLTINYIDKSAEFNLDLFIDKFSKVNLENVFVFVITAYSLGHLLSYISSITIEAYANWMYTYPSKYLLRKEQDNQDEGRRHSYWKKPFLKNWKYNFWRSILLILLLPCVVLDFILGQSLGFKTLYRKAIDPFLRDAILYKVIALTDKLGLTDRAGNNAIDIEKHDFHRIVSHYTFENAKQHQFRMVNYVALYGFLRNSCLIFNVLSWLFAVQLARDFSHHQVLSRAKTILLLALVCSTYIAFMAFMKFYRRYTLEGLMLLVVDESIIPKVNFRVKENVATF